MLDDLDKELGQRGHKSVRYADANIHVRSQRAREHALESVKGLTEDWPKLKANATETAVNRPWRWRFLEFSFGAERDARSRVAPKTIERFKDNARVLTSRSKSRTMGKRMEALNMYLRRWVAYFRLADTPTVFERLGKRIRRRLRMSLRMLTQWKKPAMRGTGPVFSGIPEQRACDISYSRKGYSHLANAPHVNKTLDPVYWQAQGLPTWSASGGDFAVRRESPYTERYVWWREKTGNYRPRHLDQSPSTRHLLKTGSERRSG